MFPVAGSLSIGTWYFFESRCSDGDSLGSFSLVAALHLRCSLPMLSVGFTSNLTPALGYTRDRLLQIIRHSTAYCKRTLAPVQKRESRIHDMNDQRDRIAL